MGLGIAENAALKSIKAHKKAFDTVSVNVANANNEYYTAKRVEFTAEVVLGEGIGVNIGDIKRNLDQFLRVEYVNNVSDESMKNVIKSYHEQIQILFGTPGEVGTLINAIDEFFSNIKLVSTSPEAKLLAVQKAEALAIKVQDIAQGLQELRYNCDQELFQGLTTINDNLLGLKEVEQAITVLTGASANVGDLLDQRDFHIKQIGEYINVTMYERNNNMAYLSTSGGVAIYSGYPYTFSYIPTTGAADFVNDLPLSPVEIYPIGLENVKSSKSTLISGGKEGEISTILTSGKISGLHQLRDIIIPQIIEELDNLAYNIRDTINSAHNDGSGLPPAETLIGTTEIIASDYHQWSGKVRVAVVNNDGTPALRGDGTALNPLVLDLEKLDNGNGPGGPDNQTIIDEINQYFYYDQLLSKLSLGNLEDIRIASTTTNMVANGIFKFQFEITNNDIYNSNFDVLGINVYDNTATLVPGALITALSPTIQSTPGDRIRNTEMQVDFGAGAGGPYTIEATVKVTEADGTVSTAVVNFIVDDTPTSPNIMNDRYAASSVIAGSATLTPPSSTKTFMQASIVDANGNVITNNQPGYLKLTTNNPAYGISFNELDSKELGYTYTNGYKVDASNRGLSYFFGLNNLFVDNGTKRNSASTMSMNQAILDNPNLLSVGRIEKSPIRVEQRQVGDTAAQANLQFNANPAIGSTIAINGQVFTYVAVPATTAQIAVGATLAQTITNTLTVINAVNAYTSGTVDKATYTSNGTDTLIMTSTGPGTAGNAYTISYNLVGGAAAALNSGAMVISNSGTFTGGTDKIINVEINPNSYEISAGSNQVAIDIAEIAVTTIKFPAAGLLPNVTRTLSEYAASVTAYTAISSQNATDAFKKQRMLTQAFYEKMKEGSGVNVDEEMAMTSVYQNTYVASATIFATTKRLYDILLETMRS